MSQGLRIAGEHQRTPNESTTFTISYENHLVSGETLAAIVSQNVVVDGATGTDLVIDSIQVATDRINVTVSLGVDNGLYFVVVGMSTNLGQTIEGAVRVVVQNAVEV